MKKRLTAILLTLCLAFSLAACSSVGSGASPQTQEPSQTSEPSTAESTQAPTTEDENSEDGADTTEVNEYGITDAALQRLVDSIKAHVTEDYLNAYSISPSDFSWPEADSEFWLHTAGIVSFAVRMSQFYNLPDSVFEGMSEEETALAKALLAGINDWQDHKDGRFLQVFDSFPDENSLIQFFLDNVSFE